MHDGKRMNASYEGGAHIEITFTPMEIGHEMINVWDHDKHEPSGLFSDWDELTAEVQVGLVRDEVVAWIKTNEEEGWTDWFEDYVVNGSY